MAKYGSADIRNVALCGPSHAGKTTLLESLLKSGGVFTKLGRVQDGTSQVDYDPHERQQKHSIFAKVFHLTHKKRELNLLDSPGYPDFIGEALTAMNAVETVALCVNAAEGISFYAQRLWNEAGAAGRARMLVVNRSDGDGVDVDKIILQAQEILGPTLVPWNLPVDAGPSISGVQEVLAGGTGWKETLVESLVTLEDGAMEKYLETGEASVDELLPLIKQGMANETFTPILFTAAEKGVGLTELLDFLAKDAPSPVRGPFFKGCDGTELNDDLHGIDPKERKEFVGRVFKTVADPFVGRLSFVRALAGEVAADAMVLNARGGKPEKMTAPMRPQGKEHAKMESAIAGDIFVLGKAESMETNDTLSVEKAPVVLPNMAMPSPMVAVAVTPTSRGEEQKLATGLKKLVSEDVTFSTERDSQTGELIAHGVSPLHVETQLHRLKTNYKVEVTTHLPRVPMRETVMAKADGHFRHKKQTGGRGQFAEVYLRIAPQERGAGFEFKDETFGGSVPKNFLPAIEKGVVDQLSKGVVAGYPVVDVVVSVYDGKHHDVDSDEHSFKRAGARAFADAFEKAKPVLLEPVVDLEVAIPSRFMGEINSDLNGRRGRISGMDAVGDMQIIKAQVPLKEVQSYAADLRSITQGEGAYTFEFSHYDTVPSNVAQEVIAAHKEGRDEEED